MPEPSTPPPRRRHGRIALIIAIVAAIIWLAFFSGQVLTGLKSSKEQPAPGQRTPTPAERTTG